MYESGPYHAENMEMLRLLRQHCRDLDAAASSADSVHLVSAQELRDRAKALAESICYVPVDCHLCGVQEDVPVRVGDVVEPNFTICERCRI